MSTRPSSRRSDSAPWLPRSTSAQDSKEEVAPSDPIKYGLASVKTALHAGGPCVVLFGGTCLQFCYVYISFQSHVFAHLRELPHEGEGPVVLKGRSTHEATTVNPLRSHKHTHTHCNKHNSVWPDKVLCGLTPWRRPPHQRREPGPRLYLHRTGPRAAQDGGSPRFSRSSSR